MDQQRNTLFFIVLSIAILVGWVFLQNQLWPPPLKKASQPSTKLEPKPSAQRDAEIAAGIIGSGSPLAGALDPVRLALSWPAQNAFEAKTLTRVVANWKALPKPVQSALLLTPPPLPLGPFVFTQLAQLSSLEEPRKSAPDPIRKVVLGGGTKYHVQAVLSTRGGGVERLTLNKFKAADWLGRPVDSELELIQEDPIVPSFLLYHYSAPEAKHPLTTLGERNWTLERHSKEEEEVQEASFSTDVPGYDGLRIIKTYRLIPGTYHLELTLEVVDRRDIKNASAGLNRFRYQLAGSHGLPIEGEWYTSVFRTAAIGMVDSRNSLWRDTQESGTISHKLGGDSVPAAGLGDSMLQYAGVMNQYFGSMIVLDDKQPAVGEGGVDRRQVLERARPTLESSQMVARMGKVVGNELVVMTAKGLERFTLLPRTQKHLEEAEIKEGQRVVISHYSSGDGQKIATWVRRGETIRPMFDDITVRVHSQEISLRPGQKVVHRFLLYHGPVKVKLLGELGGANAVPSEWVDRYTHNLHLRTLTDYGRFSWWSDLIIASTNVMHWLLNRLRFVGDGLAIILLTVLVRGMMFPISRKQAYFSVKMQELAPELKKMQEKYKNDPRGKTEATMELYRKHDVHPLGGCLPILLQMPIFIGLYFALQESIFFRLGHFLWIDNLAAPDMLVYWGESIPWISDPDSQGSFLYLGPYLNLLPIIAVSLMIVQQKIMTPPPQDEQQEMQFKMMRYMMVVFGLMFYKVAAGLCIYFIASSLWGLAERRFLPKKRTVAPAIATAPPTRSGGSSGRKGQLKQPEKKNGQMQKMRDWWDEVLRQARKK